METNRDIKELLQIALNNFDKHFGTNSGLCGYFIDLKDFNIISEKEEDILTYFIYDNKPNTRLVKIDGRYFWEPHFKRPRKEYLKHMIKKLNK